MAAEGPYRPTRETGGPGNPGRPDQVVPSTKGVSGGEKAGAIPGFKTDPRLSRNRVVDTSESLDPAKIEQQRWRREGAERHGTFPVAPRDRRYEDGGTYLVPGGPPPENPAWLQEAIRNRSNHPPKKTQ